MTGDSVLPANERLVRTGGLLRCCLATVAESTEPTDIGTVMSCKYERDANNQNLIVANDGVWEWNH